MTSIISIRVMRRPNTFIYWIR